MTCIVVQEAYSIRLTQGSDEHHMQSSGAVSQHMLHGSCDIQSFLSSLRAALLMLSYCPYQWSSRQPLRVCLGSMASGSTLPAVDYQDA